MWIGRYQVEGLLGAGGFGSVYRAHDPQIGRDVAVKLLHETRCDAVNIGRFEREARTINAIHHAGVVEIFDFGVRENGQHFFVMELLRGRSLADVLAERGALPVAEALPLLRKIAEIVDAVHAHGASHGDLKPANIMLLDDGRVKLIDFGLAKLDGDVDRTITGDAFGSPAYMAPEQCRGTRVGEASDRYGFGALAYHVLTGTPPFTGEPIAVALAHVEQAPRRPSRIRGGLPRAVDDALLALLAKEPAARPGPLVQVVASMGARRRRRTALVALLVVGTVAAVAGVALAVRHRTLRPPRAVVLHHVRTVAVADLKALALRDDGSTIDVLELRGMSEVAWNGKRSVQPGRVYRSAFAGGRVVESDGTVTLAGTAIGFGQYAEACNDGRSIAMFAENRLFVLDRPKHVVEARGANGARWSPDCRRIAWGNHDGIHITDVASGETTRLDLPLAGPVTSYAPAAFLDARTLVYCRREASQTVNVVARRLDGDETETVLHALPDDTAGCTVDTKGRRVVVGAFAYGATLEVSDLEGHTTTVVEDPTGRSVGMSFLDDAHVVVSTHPVQSTTLTEPPREAAQVITSAVESVATTGGARASLAVCEGTIAMTRYLGALVHVVLAGKRYRLLEMSSCQPRRDLALPEAGTWSPPSCHDDHCFSSLLRDDQIIAYQLSPTIVALATVDRGNAVADARPQPVFVLAPDGKHAVFHAAGDPVAYVLELAAPTDAPPQIGTTTGPPLGAAVWVDNTHFALRRDTSLVLYDLAGTASPLVENAGDAIAVSPDGKRILFRRTTRRHAVHLFERD